MTRTLTRFATLAALAATAACGGNGTSASNPVTPSALSATTAFAAQAVSPTTPPSMSALGSPHSGATTHSAKFELEGLVVSVDFTARTIVVRNTTVAVPVAAAIRRGERMLTLADLGVGQRVHVRGIQDGANMVASLIIVQGDNDGRPGRVSISGQISALAGSCPAVTFTVDHTAVLTASSTEFSDGACSDLANGVVVRVTGLRQSDGSVVALRVLLEDDEDDEDDDGEGVEVEGTVAGLQGACPSLTFMVGTTKVSTDATTRFRGGECGLIANGTQIEARGIAQPDGSIQAASVEVEDEAEDHQSD